MRGLLKFLLGMALAASAIAAPELSVEWSVEECLPGDVLELRVRMTSSSVADFEMKLPNDSAVEWVAHRRGPQRYENGVFTREDTLVVQPTMPGVVELKEISVSVRDGATTSARVLNAPPLTVRSFGGGEESFEPEALPTTDEAAAEASGRIAVWIAIGVLFLGALAFVFRRRPDKAKPKSEPQSLRREIDEMLNKDVVPPERIERLLAERSSELSDDLREALERAAYAKTSDPNRLRHLLEREAAR